MTVSDSAAVILNFGDDCSLAHVDGTIHSGNPSGRVENVVQIPRLCVYAPPHLGRVDIDKLSKLIIDHLVMISDQPYQVANQQRLIIGDLMVRHDDEPRDPQHQLRVLSPLAETLGEFNHPRLIPKDISRVPSREQSRVVVQANCKWNADEWDSNLDDSALQEILSDEGDPLGGGQYCA